MQKNKRSRMVEMVFPLGIDGYNPIEKFDWDEEFPGFPIPPENTQIVGVGNYFSDGLIATDRNTREGYLLSYDEEEGEYYWKTQS